jgi:hypothetical protein
MFGDCAPDTVTFDMISKWRGALERKLGRSVAHKTLRVWRTLWNIMLGMKVARGVDASKGVRNHSPAPRHQRWSDGEAVRLAKSAWRRGYKGLACVIAVGWDTGFSPVDVRTLAARHRAAAGGRLIFNRQADGRAKTGRAAIGTVSRRTERLVGVYLDGLGIDLHPEAILFRTRSGASYRAETLSHDFSAVRELTFPGDERRLADMRRSGVVGGGGRGCNGARTERKARQLNRPIQHPAQDLFPDEH